MSDLNTHVDRWARHRQPRPYAATRTAALRELDDLASDFTRSEQAEHRAAVDDRLDYRAVGGRFYHADDLPDRKDVE